MSTSKSMMAPCRCVKRLKLSPLSSRLPQYQQPVAHKSTSQRPRSVISQSSKESSSDPLSSTYKADPISVQKRLQRLEDRETSIQDKLRGELIDLAKEHNVPLPSSLQPAPDLRVPRALSLLYLNPLKREPKDPNKATKMCDLQIRSYFVRNLEFVADFALRAAYFMDLPASGPVPLPRITERITVPKGPFVHKKAQENFERITMRRLIQIKDGHPDSIRRWLNFVRKWSWYGVGMKANVWDYQSLEDAKKSASEDEIEEGIDNVRWSLIGRRKGLEDEKSVAEWMDRQGFGASPTRVEATTESARA